MNEFENVASVNHLNRLQYIYTALFESLPKYWIRRSRKFLLLHVVAQLLGPTKLHFAHVGPTLPGKSLQEVIPIAIQSQNLCTFFHK